MAFHPEHLPKTVYEIYKKGPLMWMVAVQTAIQVGIKNPDSLTNMVFYVHHPELDGRPLRKDETKLIAQWKGFRTLIVPLIQGSKTPTGSNNSLRSSPLIFNMAVTNEN